MKKTMLILTAFVSMAAQAQELSMGDALRYSQDNQNGTARFRAMSGAFGALGGDMSAITVNPAGSAVFSDSQLALTLNNTSTRNQSNYFGTSTTESDNSFDLNQAGFVFVFDGKPEGWNKFSLAVNYDNLNNFNNSIFSAGTNPTASVGDYFLNFANFDGGYDISLLQTQPGETISSLYQFLGENYGFGAQQAFLGYQAFVTDQASDYSSTNRNYVSLVPAGGDYYQENTIFTSGYNGKLTFNAATSYKDKIYIGLNLNSHFTDYRQHTSVYESNTNSPTSGVQRLRFDNDLQTFGNGFSFQLGAIAKITDFRVGLAYESPTWLTLTDRTMQSLRAVSADAAGEFPTDVINPNVENLYAPYRIQTPSKWTGSLAYVFGKRGLISMDYAIKDYSNLQFKPKSDYVDLNSSMGDLLDMSGELRLGAEYRIKAFSLRGGYRMDQSPYKDNSTIGDLTGYSAGLGYNFGNTRLDLAYSFAERDMDQRFLTSGMTDAARINSEFHNVSLSLLFQL
ncbi:MAG: transporter [Flavobacterium sp.]|nr:transporter [Flavobacterium sp.]